MLSIIINNYNYMQFVGQCIESVLSQESRDVELIIVDDGSTDDSLVVIKKYSEHCRIVSKPNGGQASAFNLGFREARGDWIYFLDADDYLLPGAIEEILLRIQSSGLSKIHFPLQEYVEGAGYSGKTIEDCHLSRGNVMLEIATSGHHRWPPTSGNVFNRDFLSQIMPMPEKEYRISADHYLNTLAPFYGDILAIEKPLAAYRRHGKNLYAVSESQGASFLKNARLLSRGVEIQRQMLEKRAVSYDREIFLRRDLVAARIVAERLADSPRKFFLILQVWLQFFQSKTFAKAPLRSKLQWSIFVLLSGLLPLPLLVKVINLRRPSRVITGES